VLAVQTANAICLANCCRHKLLEQRVVPVLCITVVIGLGLLRLPCMASRGFSSSSSSLTCLVRLEQAYKLAPGDFFWHTGLAGYQQQCLLLRSCESAGFERQQRDNSSQYLHTHGGIVAGASFAC
jgi:hypothetical protein